MRNSLLGAELKAILSNKKILIPIVAVLFIPVLYAGMFLWAFWDPYERLSDLPVAIVNEDKGANFEGEELSLGEELVKELQNSDEFQFQFVSAEEAYRDLEKRKYYMVVEIPKNFSENATTLLEDQPKKLELKYVPNESFNFLSAQIGETAMKEIRAELQKNVTKTYAEAIFDKVDEMADGFTQASDGAKELNDGAEKLQNGSKELMENLMKLAEKSIEFKQGAFRIDEGSKQLVTGIQTLDSGLHQLVEGHSKLLEGTKTIQNGTNELADGMTQVHEGLTAVDSKMKELLAGMSEAKNGANELSSSMPNLTDHTSKLSTGASQVAQGVAVLQDELLLEQQKMTELVQTLKQMLTPEQFAQIAAKLPTEEETKVLQANLEQLKMGSAQVAEGTLTLNEAMKQQLAPNIQKLASGLEKLLAGQNQLGNGIHELAMGTSKLQDGVKDLQAGEEELVARSQTFHQKLIEAHRGSEQLVAGGRTVNNGLQLLTDGAGQLSDGAHQLAEGSKALADGTDKLHDGTEEMYEKLANAAKEANEVEVSEANYDMMAEPVTIDHKGIHKVPNYGTGFAPYFMSLGLFVGALVLSVVYPFRDTVQMPKSGLQWFGSKFGLLVSFGVIQALIVDLMLLLGLGIEVKSVPLFMMATVITSFTFIALVHMLVTIFDNPGRFVAILILIFQLTASAGTFPLELIPSTLQHFNVVLPMTYSVSALKAVISSGDYAFMWQNVSILLIFAISFALLTALYLTMKFKKSYANYVSEELGA